jgi:hypothetical protein
MNAITDLRLQVANDQIRRMHTDAARRRLARDAGPDDADGAAHRSIIAAFGRSLRVLGLAS